MEGERGVHCRWVLCTGLSTAGWSPRPVGAGLSQVPLAGTNHPPVPAPPSSEAARQRCLRRKCRERLGPLARGSAHCRFWKSWRRCRGKPAGAPGAWRPPALFWTSSRSPPPPLPTSSVAGTQHSTSSFPDLGGRSRLPLTPVTWLKDGLDAGDLSPGWCRLT